MGRSFARSVGVKCLLQRPLYYITIAATQVRWTAVAASVYLAFISGFFPGWAKPSKTKPLRYGNLDQVIIDKIILKESNV